MTIPLTKAQKIQILNSKDIFIIMQDILLRDEKIDQEKEHFWLVGLASNNLTQYIELVSLGSINSTTIEPMNVFRIAVLKGSAKVIMVHNHPSGELEASLPDIDTTDRLFQVGRILNVPVIEHLIISTTEYFSFLSSGILAEIEKSDKYVPKYEMIERIHTEEKRIRAEAVRAASEKNLDKGIKRGKKQGIEEGLQKGLLKGKKEGEEKLKQEKIGLAQMMKQKNEPLEKIMEYTGLSKVAIAKL